MKADIIAKIEIDELGRLLIYPEKEKFSMIWRSATEVHWDSKGFLYSPKPREWTYFDWYQHIISVVKTDENCTLSITEKTLFIEIPESLKQKILHFKN